MAIVVGDIYRVSIEYLMDNQLCYNVLHARAMQNQSDGTATNNYLLTLAGKVESLVTGIAAMQSSAVTAQKMSVGMVAGTGGAHGFEEELNVAGAVTDSELLPGFVAGVIRHSTGLVGRSRRGRTHVLGLVESYTIGGRLTAAGEAAMTTAAAAFANHWLGTAGWSGGVFSRTLTLAPTTPAFFAAVSYSWAPIPGTMYSRRIGVGS